LKPTVSDATFIVMNVAELGATVRERRQELRLTQRALSEISGVSLHTLSDIESGKGNPTLETLDLLLEPLGLELSVAVRALP